VEYHPFSRGFQGVLKMKMIMTTILRASKLVAAELCSPSSVFAWEVGGKWRLQETIHAAIYSTSRAVGTPSSMALVKLFNNPQKSEAAAAKVNMPLAPPLVAIRMEWPC
jgi:hypothetical protein